MFYRNLWHVDVFPSSSQDWNREELFVLSHFNFKEKEWNIYDHFMILKNMANILLYFLLMCFQKYILHTVQIRIL